MNGELEKEIPCGPRLGDSLGVADGLTVLSDCFFLNSVYCDGL